MMVKHRFPHSLSTPARKNAGSKGIGTRTTSNPFNYSIRRPRVEVVALKQVLATYWNWYQINPKLRLCFLPNSSLSSIVNWTLLNLCYYPSNKSHLHITKMISLKLWRIFEQITTQILKCLPSCKQTDESFILLQNILRYLKEKICYSSRHTSIVKEKNSASSISDRSQAGVRDKRSRKGKQEEVWHE